jgi:hypothetical protein
MLFSTVQPGIIWRESSSDHEHKRPPRPQSEHVQPNQAVSAVERNTRVTLGISFCPSCAVAGAGDEAELGVAAMGDDEARVADAVVR